jgi:clan AA aspartic protease
MPLLALHSIDLLHPTLVLLLSDEKSQQTTQVPAIIDTGFDSYLTLPREMVANLNLEILGETDVELANGQTDVYQIAKVKITIPDLDYNSYIIEVLIGDDDECLIGGKLLHQICKAFTINYQKSQLQFKL